MGLLLSRQRTQPHHQHQHSTELLDALKRIEHQLVTLVQEQRQFYEESVQRDEAARERTDAWIATQTQWRENDIAWRDAEQAQVWQLAEEAKTHARYMSELATQQERSTTLPYGSFSDDTIAPPPSKRRSRTKAATSEQAALAPTTSSDEPTETDAPPPATEQASA